MTTGTPQPIDPGSPRGGSGGSRPGPRPRRGLSLLPLIMVGWALLEIWLLILLGNAAGGFTVFLVLLAGLVVGMLVINRAGRRAFQRLSEALQQQQPGAAPADAARTGGGNGLAALGGLLLIIPGLLSDVIGLLCLFPPTAALLRGATRRLLASGTGPLGTAYQEARSAEQMMRARRPDGRIVPGEVIDEHDTPHRTDGEEGGQGGTGGDPRRDR